jgi:hypothetical protein
MVGQLNDKAKVYDYMDPVGILENAARCRAEFMAEFGNE